MNQIADELLQLFDFHDNHSLQEEKRNRVRAMKKNDLLSVSKHREHDVMILRDDSFIREQTENFVQGDHDHISDVVDVILSKVLHVQFVSRDE